MEIKIEPGRYVVAVSGGVDSVALLDLLKERPDLKLVVAHFDHGIREDSAKDRRLVQELADIHRLPFVFHEGRLGSSASEAAARAARYNFLHKVRGAAAANGLITAHHQDDLIETALLNLMRGTGRRGLSSLRSTDNVIRPLLHVPKAELIAHAKRQGLQWREDPTNQDPRHLRNYIRHKLVPRLSPDGRQKFLNMLGKARDLNQKISYGLVNLLHTRPAMHALDRLWFIQLPHAVAREVMAEWLNQRGNGYDVKTLERLVRASKVLKPNSKADIKSGWTLRVGKDTLELSRSDFGS